MVQSAMPVPAPRPVSTPAPDKVLRQILPLPPHDLEETPYMIVFRTCSPIIFDCICELFPFSFLDRERQTVEDFKKIVLHYESGFKSILPSGQSASKFWKDGRYLCIIVFAYSLKDEFILPLHNLVLEYFRNNPNCIPPTVNRRRTAHGSKVSDAAHQICRANIFPISQYELKP